VSDDLQGGTRSYRPGTWFGIFGAGASVLLPPSEKARVAALWELVDDGAGFDEVLDALISGGLRELPGFVLVSERDGETKVVLRGAARATFLTDGETVELEGSRATTWVERSLHGVTRMTVQVTDEADGPDHSIAGGLVRLSRLDEPPYSPDAGGRVDGEASFIGDNVADEADVEPADDGAGAEDAPEDEVSSVVEPTSLEEPAGEAGSDGEDEDDLDEPARHELPTEAVDIAALWPSPAPPAPEAPEAPPAVATLTFSTGETVDVDRAILIGRAPEPGRHPTTGRPRLVAVPSPQKEISSTHLEVRPGTGADHGSAVVTDLGSTNGTVVVQPGQPPEDLLAGVTVPLLPGAILDVGDGVTIKVSAP
jgi:hypothetical protein